MFKFIIVVLLLCVIVSLFVSFYYLIKDPSTSKRVVKGLSIRVALCILIMLLLFVGARYGLISPHGFGE